MRETTFLIQTSSDLNWILKENSKNVLRFKFKWNLIVFSFET
jgi:hypothetical protein